MNIKLRAWVSPIKMLCRVTNIDFVNKEVIAVIDEARCKVKNYIFDECTIEQYVGCLDKNKKLVDIKVI